MLIAFPIGIFIVTSLIFTNALAWQQACVTDITCDVGFQVIPSNAPLLLLMTGRFDILWSALFGPTIDWAVLGALFSLVAGAILLLLSLGLTVSFQALATGASFGMNEQGTKLVQMLGIGLLIWGATVATIGGWESYFDSIATGLGFTFNLVLEIAFLIGVCWQSVSQSA